MQLIIYIHHGAMFKNTVQTSSACSIRSHSGICLTG